MKTNADVQRALIALGYNLGKGGPSGKGDDGLWGATSRKLLAVYQASKRLAPTGIITPDTLTALFPADKAPVILPPWYLEAQRLMGTREIAGRQHSSVIMGWARKLRLAYADDETAWCGLFVAQCMSIGVPTEAQPAGPLGARNWLRFGQVLATPTIGAVLVFWRGSEAGWLGHVGFYAGERPGAYRVLGGNQGNCVSEQWLDSDRLLDARWPSSYPLPSAGRIVSAAGGALSTNEA